MKINENFYPNCDCIIMYILSFADRNLEEILEVYTNEFTSIKQGTLYSIITRLKNKNFINEYRMSNSDGSRRKYFSLTSVGLDNFKNEYSNYFIYAKPLEKVITSTPVYDKIEKIEEKTENIVDTNINEVEKLAKEEISLDSVKSDNDIEFDKVIEDIDFSSFNNLSNVSLDDSNKNIDNLGFEENPKIFEEQTNTYVEEIVPSGIENVNFQKVEEQPIFDVNQTINTNVEENYDSANTSSMEYKSILSNLFPKNEKNYTKKEENFNKPATSSNNNEDIYTYAKNQGYNIRTSKDTNRYQGNRILINLLRFHTSIIWYVGLFLVFAILLNFFKSENGYDGIVLRNVAIFSLIVPAVFLVIYLLSKQYSVNSLCKFKDIIEIALIICITTIIVTIAIYAIRSYSIYDNFNFFRKLITPCLIAISFPIYIIIEYLLLKLEYYQTI